MFRELRTCVTLFAILFVLTGVGYPLATYALSQATLSDEANGSLLKRDGTVIGSDLIGQNFTSDKYFHPRPSAGNGYDAANSGGSNLSPSSVAFVGAVNERVTALRATDNTALIPVDMVTASASGLDPDISVGAARFQAARIATARGMTPIAVEALISRSIEPRAWGILGEERVNVLRINLALDATESVVAAP